MIATTGEFVSDRPFRLFPPAASSQAHEIDMVYFALLIVSALILLLALTLIVFFAVRYRAGSNADRTDPIRKTWRYEITWTAVLMIIALGLFVWGGRQYVSFAQPPSDARTYHVVGRQWMWEIQHPDGRRELNSLHLPAGEPVRLVLTSEDVVHSFFVPAFRLKMDAVPDRYTVLWFTPEVPGAYHLFCAEYCGTDHARMAGTVTVLQPEDYQRWLEVHPPAPTAQPLEQTASASFRELGCNQCHRPDTAALAPKLEGLFGRTVQLADGSTVVADEQYIRESIIDPAAKITAGYRALMPTYAGMVTEEQLMQLVAAVRALGDDRDTGGDQP